MSDEAKKAGNFVQSLSEALLPSPSAEKLIFRRFQGSKIADAVMYGASLTEKDIDTVALRVNPQNVSFSKKKVIQRVQTSAPGRFVVFDWGSELTILSISGNTGLLLSSTHASEDIAFGSTLNNVVSAIATAAATDLKQNFLLDASTYYETLQMSPKYNTFKRLEKMFDLQDADSDIITLEFGDMAIYRGFFEEFTFEIVAETPWNWAYNINFIILADLTEKIRRWDNQFNRKNSNIQIVPLPS